jgi:glycosyltransferase involved in cell wall biosynthesis
MTMTVLMAVYGGDDATHLQEALESLCQQTTSPDAMVLVADGPLNRELDAVIQRYIEPLHIHFLRLDSNRGLAAALNEGLQHVQTNWVMRFDADDVCSLDRVALQKSRAEQGDVDVFGGQIEEFQRVPGDSQRVRRVPCEESDIQRFARRRNPFNHMTVCFRVSVVREVGGYPLIPWMEDYALWSQLMAAGARLGNLPEVLVHARVGNGMLSRRGGLRYVRSELQMQRLMCRLHLKSAPQACVDGVLRSLVFLAPKWVRALVYRASAMRSRTP